MILELVSNKEKQLLHSQRFHEPNTIYGSIYQSFCGRQFDQLIVRPSFYQDLKQYPIRGIVNWFQSDVFPRLSLKEYQEWDAEIHDDKFDHHDTSIIIYTVILENILDHITGE